MHFENELVDELHVAVIRDAAARRCLGLFHGSGRCGLFVLAVDRNVVFFDVYDRLAQQ